MLAFYLGTHKAVWLARLDVPLFVSDRTLAGRTRLPRARAPWALDSGGFSELRIHGRWTVPLPEYVRRVRRYAAEVGQLAWAAPQDWMCEPSMLARTGLSVAEHQRRTVDNLLGLWTLGPELPWVPVLQGWTLDDYLRCAELYGRAGVDLAAEPLVGVGSVCRRQSTAEIEAVFDGLAREGLRLHGFGVKTRGLARYADSLTSADSLAWSYDARRAKGGAMPGCAHRTCSNCPRWALRWRRRVLAQLEEVQLRLALA